MRSIELLRKESFLGKLKFLLSDTLVFGTVGMANRLIGVLLVPIIVRVFEVAEYAQIDGIRVFSLFTSGALMMGLEQATARFIASEEDKREKAEIIGQGLSLALFLSLLGCGLILVSSNTLGDLLFEINSTEITSAFRLVAFSMPTGVILAFSLMLLKWHFKRKQYMFLSIFSTASVIAMTYAAVVVFSWGIVGVFAAQLLSGVIVAIVAIILCREFLIMPSQYSRVRELLRFGAPLMAVVSLANFQPFIERLLIIRLLGLEALGLFSVGQSFSRLFRMPADSFLVAWSPFAMAIYKEEDASKTFDMVLLVFSVICGVILVALIGIAQPALVLFASEKYLMTLGVVLPLAFGYLIEAAVSVTGIGILIAKKTHLSSISYTIALMITVAAMYLLSRPFGIVGIAYGFLIGKVVLLVLQSFFAIQLSNIRYHFWPAIVIGLVAFVSAFFISRLAWQH